MNTTPDLIKIFCPTGKLRAAINLGNAVLANRDPAGQPGGVSVDMARALAAQLGVELELVVVDGAAKSVSAIGSGQADVGFFAIDPLRADTITFTGPYVLIEGAYLVRDASPLTRNEDVDQSGTRITVAKGSAYDLYLSREIKHATLERAPTSQAVVGTFIEQGFEVAAGVKQQLEADMAQRPGMRLLPGRFMVIRQAMGLGKSRGEKADALLGQFVKDQISSGAVAGYLQKYGIQGASVAPA